jgi:DNA-binding YbaB/EbfC family protein
VGARAKAEEIDARRRALEEPERKEKEKAKHENEMHRMINKSIDVMKKYNFSDDMCNETKRALTYAYTEESQKTQKELEATEYEGSSSFVKVKINGNKDIISVKIDMEESIEKDDIELLEDMIVSALKDAEKKATLDKEKKLGKFGQGMSGLF